MSTFTKVQRKMLQLVADDNSDEIYRQKGCLRILRTLQDKGLTAWTDATKCGRYVTPRGLKLLEGTKK
jgi:hypothetical protein